VPHRKIQGAWLFAAFVSLAIMAPTDALATFGGRSNDPFFTLTDMAPNGQADRLKAVFRSHSDSVTPLKQQIDAIRAQITAQLVATGALDPSQFVALEQQMFDLRSQRDALDLAEAVEIRSTLTAAQLSQAAQRHLGRDEEATLRNPSQFPTSTYLPGDLFGDHLGYTRGLTLASDQLQQMTSIENADAEAFRSIQQQRRVVSRRISELLTGSNPVTLAQLAPLQQQASTLKNQIDTLRLTMTIQIRAVLTPVQLAQAATLRQQRAQESTLLTEARSAD